MEFSRLQQRALAVRERYRQLEKATYGREWTSEEVALGLVGDVGDLAKLVAAKNGVRAIENADAKLGHELADCLWTVMVLADQFSIDLQGEFLKAMDGLEERIGQPR